MDHPLFDLPTTDADDLGAHGAFRLVGVFFPPLGEFQRSTYRVYGHDAEERFVSARASCEADAETPDTVRARLQQEAADDVRAMIDAIGQGAGQG